MELAWIAERVTWPILKAQQMGSGIRCHKYLTFFESILLWELVCLNAPQVSAHTSWIMTKIKQAKTLESEGSALQPRYVT